MSKKKQIKKLQDRLDKVEKWIGDQTEVRVVRENRNDFKDTLRKVTDPGEKVYKFR